MSAVIDSELPQSKRKPRTPSAKSELVPAPKGTQMVAQRPDAGSLLAAITQAAANPDVDIEKMERLFAMHQQMVSREAEVAFNDALSRVQAKIQPVVNNAFNDQTKSHYAKLSQINKEIAPIYSAEGFSISFDTETTNTMDPIPPGMIRVIAILSHAQGHSRRYHIDLPPDAAGIAGRTNKTMVHATGSTNAYGRRYLVLMIFNVSTEDDTDGNRPADETGRTEREQPRDEPRGELQPYPEDKFKENLPKWREVIASGRATPERIIAIAASKGILSDEQKEQISAPFPPAAKGAPPVLFEKIKDKLTRAADLDVLDVDADLISEVKDPAQQEQLRALYQQRRAQLGATP